MTRKRRWGAELIRNEGAHFSLYAPEATAVEVVLSAGTFPMTQEWPGAWGVFVNGVKAGERYQFRLAGQATLYADPASRFQPEGPHQASEIIDSTFSWTDAAFVPPEFPIIYELHLGTFSPEGTWAGAKARLPALKEVGIDMVELMPVNEFAGRHGWGYDGVQWFAPFHGYGRPEEMRAFVNEAHTLGIAVILDVVYNHLGPDGNMLGVLVPKHASREASEWGQALNFDEAGSEFMRALVTDNAAYWIDEFHLDGLRLDATQAISDRSPRHVVTELVEAARAAAAGKRIFVVAENEPQKSRFVRSIDRGGHGLDALWNDDFHHCAVVATTGHREAYFKDYEGSARELLACVKHGFLFQGQRYAWQEKRRGTSTRGLPPRSMVAFLENHDQLANYGLGARFWQRAQPGDFRALTALLLLAPWTPMLFQGQEWSSASSFAYFADHQPELNKAVSEGRAKFLSQFPRYGGEEARSYFSDPTLEATFEQCKLDWAARDRPESQRALALHRDLMALRRTDVTLTGARERRLAFDGTLLNDRILLLRFWGEPEDGRDDRLLWLNLGPDWSASCLSEPLYAPPSGSDWKLTWSSEQPRYGGQGTRLSDEPDGLFVAGHAAELFTVEKGRT